MEPFDFTKLESLGYTQFAPLSCSKWITDKVMIVASPREENDIYFMRFSFSNGRERHSVLLSTWLNIEDFGKFEELIMSLHNDPNKTESDLVSAYKLSELKRIFNDYKLAK